MSSIVEISLAQVALITAETALLLRRIFAPNRALLDLARRIDRFVSARADTREARILAGELARDWTRFENMPEYREFLMAPSRLRSALKQDQVTRRLRQMEAALRSEPAPAAKRRSRRRGSAA